MTAYSAMLSVDKRGSRVLVTDTYGHDLLKARLPLYSEHPRALLTLLEGVALYAGAALCVATSVAADVKAGPWCGPLGDGLYPLDSALVRFELVEGNVPRRRLRGMGRFHDVRQLRLSLPAG
jgi:hypothetical protein